MPARLLLLFLAFAVPALAQQAPRALDPEELSLQNFLQAVETSISTMDRARWIELLSPTADRDQALEFFDAMVPQGITRVVVKERDRVCVDCGSNQLLQYDHNPEYETTRRTVVEELELRCAPCHARRHKAA